MVSTRVLIIRTQDPTVSTRVQMLNSKFFSIRTQDPTVSTRVQMLNSINFYPAGVNPGFPPSGPDGVNPGTNNQIKFSLRVSTQDSFQI